MKDCRVCKETKANIDFYARHRICKKCCSARSMAWGRTNKGMESRRTAKAKYNATEHGRAKNEAYRVSDAGRESQRRGQIKFRQTNPESVERSKKKYYERFPERKIAKEKLRAAVRYGKIHKPNTCELCGSEGVIHGHHTDYFKPLDVQWLCQPCHVAVHHGRNPSEYRSQEGLTRADQATYPPRHA